LHSEWLLTKATDQGGEGIECTGEKNLLWGRLGRHRINLGKVNLVNPGQILDRLKSLVPEMEPKASAIGFAGCRKATFHERGKETVSKALLTTAE